MRCDLCIKYTPDFDDLVQKNVNHSMNNFIYWLYVEITIF